MYQWRIHPEKPPVAFRNCKKCGCRSEFECSGKFRINAQQNHLDIFLIYKCRKCDSTWNMELYSRIRPGRIDKALLDQFYKNDRETALRFACSPSVLRKNRVDADYDGMEYTVERDTATAGLEKTVTLEIIPDYPLGLRLGKLIGREFGISGQTVKNLCESGNMVCPDFENPYKIKISGRVVVSLNLGKAAGAGA